MKGQRKNDRKIRKALLEKKKERMKNQDKKLKKINN